MKNMFAIVSVPVCPMRKESAHRSEMVSQLLWGEWGTVLEETTDFVRIRHQYDQYEGWCQRSQLWLNDTAPAAGSELTADWVNTIDVYGEPMQVSFGTPLDLADDPVLSARYGIGYSGNRLTPYPERSPALIEQLGKQFINTAYLWGGRSVFGIDCSGFVQQIYRCFGIPLPRDAYQQAELGEVVGFLQETIPGDLAFFDNAEGRITHVGILLTPDRIIHASGQVRIDRIDSMGIVNTRTGERTHQLRLVKRVPNPQKP
ncbi:MAG: C40 family peptidase [Chitinophagaceae bacterium]|nr:C40 family peptidase [Chitinophagaceae bacterium]